MHSASYNDDDDDNDDDDGLGSLSWFTFQLAFQGKIGSSYYSDIAIDDITVTRGPCAGSGDY